MTVVTTARLVLRPFAPEDAPAYAAIWAKPEVVRFLPGGEGLAARAQELAETRAALFAAQWRVFGYGPWAAVEQASGALLGHLGLRRLPELGETELLYMLDRPAWGKGYATEGARAAVAWAFAQTDLPRLVAFAAPENRGSIRVMEKAGFAYDGAVRVFGLDAARYTLTRP